MDREQYEVKLAKLRQSPKYKEWEREQKELINHLRIDTEAIDPGETRDDDALPA